MNDTMAVLVMAMMASLAGTEAARTSIPSTTLGYDDHTTTEPVTETTSTTYAVETTEGGAGAVPTSVILASKFATSHATLVDVDNHHPFPT
jgi:hypothetical protein